MGINRMENRISIVKTSCHDYNDKEEIKKAVYKSLELLGLDKNHIGTNTWNPLSEFISPGMTVLLKPNYVMNVNRIVQNGTDCLYTQSAIIEVVINLVLKALNDAGHIIIGDAPMQECDFESLKLSSGIQDIIDKIPSSKAIDIKLVDFRELYSTVKGGVHFNKLNPEAKGTIVDLGKNSQFYTDKKDWRKYRITNYDPDVLPLHHNGDVNEYYISDYILQADVIINLPKPKTHRKAGVTISLKNFVGANTRKEFLPHHTLGSIEEGGDEYKNKSVVYSLMNKTIDSKNRFSAHKKYIRAWLFAVFSRMLYEILKHKRDFIYEGNWYGNDTISKTITDINIAVRYANKDGKLEEKECRKIFIIGDMIISGEGEGPVAPTPKNCGIIASGFNTVCYDEAISTIMGFDYTKIPSITRARNLEGQYKLVEKNINPIILSNDNRLNNKDVNEISSSNTLHFVPSSGWKNYIELP